MCIAKEVSGSEGHTHTCKKSTPFSFKEFSFNDFIESISKTSVITLTVIGAGLAGLCYESIMSVIVGGTIGFAASILLNWLSYRC